ncbi:MAG: hemerythrin domain-containing protein [Nitrospirae bacterium]|nr:hemerythrin domain-containing protein [Nitrospirota bacterium]
MDVLQHLSEDHKKIVQKINKLPAALLKARQNLDILLSLSNEIEQDLSLHEKIEDLLFFPALSEKVGEQALQPLIKEHAESKKARELFMAAISELKEQGEPYPPDKIKEMSNHGYKLMRILSTHLTREDQLLFPQAKTLLQPETLEYLEAQANQLK